MIIKERHLYSDVLFIKMIWGFLQNDLLNTTNVLTIMKVNLMYQFMLRLRIKPIESGMRLGYYMQEITSKILCQKNIEIFKHDH